MGNQNSSNTKTGNKPVKCGGGRCECGYFSTIRSLLQCKKCKDGWCRRCMEGRTTCPICRGVWWNN